MANELEKADAQTPVTHLDEKIAELERDLTAERQGRKIDRFVGVLIGIILLDIHVFTSMSGWGGPIAITVLEIILLLIVAERLDISVIERLLDKVLGSLGGGGTGD